MPQRAILAAIALVCALASSAYAAPPPELVRAIIQVESGDNPHAVGRHGEIGLMQIRLETARSVGFTGARHELFEANQNIRFGVAYLDIAWRRAAGDVCKAASLYNMGAFARPRCTAYGRRVRALMAGAGARP